MGHTLSFLVTEAHTCGEAGGGEDGCVDAHHTPCRVQQRAPRVAWVDGGVCLDGAPYAAPQLALDFPAQAADDACSATACCSVSVELGTTCSKSILIQYCS